MRHRDSIWNLAFSFLGKHRSLGAQKPLKEQHCEIEKKVQKTQSFLLIDWEKEFALLSKQSFDGFPGSFQELIC